MIHIVGFSSILDIGKEEDLKMIRDKLIDGKKLLVKLSSKIKGNNETSKVCISCLDDISGIVTPLCIILPQMSGWIKYFKNCGKNMSFKIEDDKVYLK